MLKDILFEKRCFKLICGAGNEDTNEVEKLVAIYALAGANYFDLSARPEVVLAAKKGLARVSDRINIKDCYLNVSVGIKGDPHVSKARINKEKCISCGSCADICDIQKAIFLDEFGKYEVNKTKCIGCERCFDCCPVEAIKQYSKQKPLEEVLPPLLELGLDSLEFHAVSVNTDEINKQWKQITKMYDGIMSLCTDRSLIGDKQLIERINKIIEGRAPYTTIIQADGVPMGGCEDTTETTLQAIATAQIVQRAKLPVYLMLSGGTNSTTTELSKLFKVSAHGVAIGSWARKIIKQYLERDDFFENKENFEKALIIAKGLVEKSLKNL